MSKHGTLLPIPVDLTTGLGLYMHNMVQDWLDGDYAIVAWPRSVWLGQVEAALLMHFPQSSSADRKLTARHYAPFLLRDGHDVP